MDAGLALLGGGILVLGLLSRLLKRNSLSPVLLALLVGAAVGPAALGWVDLTEHVPRTRLLEETARFTLALAVADIGLKLTRRDLRVNARRVLLLLVIGMPAMWLAGSAGGWLVLGLPVAAALVLGAALTPTDPAVASGLVSGVLPARMLPQRLRHTLQTESAANDGLAIPLVLFSGLLVSEPLGSALPHWLLTTARELGLAAAIGIALGWLAGRLLRVARQEALVAETYIPLMGVAVALLTAALVHLLGGSGILGAFLASLAMSLTSPEELRPRISETLTALSRLAVVTTFAVFGTVLPWSGWVELGWSGLVFVAWILLLRRPLWIWLTLLPSDTGRLSRAWLGWFGPLGVAGIYYLAYAERFHLADYERLFAAGSLAIAASVVAHTLTSTPGVRRYARRVGTERPEGETVTLSGTLP